MWHKFRRAWGGECVQVRAKELTVPQEELPRAAEAFAFPRPLFLLGLLSCVFGVQGAVTKLWENAYDGPPGGDTHDEARIVLRTGNDVVVVGETTDWAGNRTDVLLIRYSGADGSMVWTQRYNSPENLNDRPAAAAVDAAGNVHVVAEVSRPQGGSDFYTAKYAAADGALLWERTDTGPENRLDRPTSLALDGAGNVFVAGHSHNGRNYDFYIAKYQAANGTLLWEQRYNSPADGNDYLNAMVVDSSGDVVLTGALNFAFYTVKYDGDDGGLIWERLTGGPGIGHLEGLRIALDGNEDVIVMGSSFFESDNIYVAKYRKADGAVLWEKVFDGGEGVEDRGHSLAVDSQGSVIAGGASGGDLLLLKYGPDGAFLWEGGVSGQESLQNFAYSIVPNAAGDVFAAGVFDAEYYVGRFSETTGAMIWEKKNLFSGFGRSVVLDASGDVVVTGAIQNTELTNQFPDFHTARYQGADGTLVWEKRYIGVASSSDHGLLAEVDPSGNVVVSGSSGTNSYLGKFAAADGAKLWEKIENRRVLGLKVDQEANVLVTGAIQIRTNAITKEGMYTLKRNGANGEVLWEAGFSGDAGTNAWGWALNVDTNGNVIAAGTFGTGQTNDIYLAKYRGNDGGLIWERRYASANGGNDRPTSVLVDKNQDIVVTGSSDLRMYAGKYRGSDGTVVWEMVGERFKNYAWAPTLGIIDANGDVFLTGGSWSEMLAIKLRGDNGSPLWEDRFTISTNDQVGFSHIALDSTGNVIVGGYYADKTVRENANARFVKYGGRDGAILWERRVGVSNIVDQPVGLFVDEADDVVAGIVTRGSTAATGFTWMKMSGSDGTTVDQLTDRELEAMSMAKGVGGRIAVTGEKSSDIATLLLRDEPRARLQMGAPRSSLFKIRWPAGQKGWQLETVPSLGGGFESGGWTRIGEMTSTNEVSIPIGTGVKSGFFRLVEP